MKKIITIIASILVILAVVIVSDQLYSETRGLDKKLSGVSYSMTYGTTTINTTSTQVFSSFASHAEIFTTSTAVISCYADGLTAASSGVALGGGVTFGNIIGTSATSTFSGKTSACWGYRDRCIPQIQKVNCRASFQVTVGTVHD